MSIGLASDLTIYNEQVHGGFVEQIYQEVDGFNAASGGTLQLLTSEHLGDYKQETFADLIASLVTRRDTTSFAAVTDLAATTDEFVGVKRNYKVGPVAQSLDAFRKMGKDQQHLSFILGQQMAKAVPQIMLESMLMALEAKLDSVAALEEDGTAAVITSASMIAALANFGDRANDIVMWIMHSKPYYDLLTDNVADAIYRANGVAVMQGTPVTYGRPVLVTDSASLLEAAGVSTGIDKYSTLGLVRGAATCEISEPPTAVLDLVSGLENIVYRFQGEGAYTVSLKGCEWDITNGGANPTDAALATATNWDTQVSDNKGLPGVILTTR